MKIFTTLSLSLFSLSLVLNLSCKKPFNDISIVVEPQVIKYTALLKIVDASDGSEPLNSTVAFSGANAASVYDLAGKKSFIVNRGFISFGLVPSKKPVTGQPVGVNVVITAPGYLPVGKVVDFSADEFEQSLEVQLIKVSSPPPGVSVASSKYGLADNALIKNMTIVTPVAGEIQESTAIDVSAGTRFLDQDRKVIAGNVIQVQSVHFDTRNNASLSAFPGGLVPTDVKLQDGSHAAGTFTTTGFTSIDFKSGNTAVKFFDQPVSITMTTDPTTINPETKLPVKAGDIIPVWSYVPEDGYWKYESAASFVNDNGVMKVTFATSHLTWYNLAWYSKTCASSNSFRIAGASDLKDLYVLQMFPRNATRPISTAYVYGSVDSAFKLHHIPDMDLKLRVYRASEFNFRTYYTGQGTQTTNFTEMDYARLCTSGGVINFPTDTRPTTSFELVGICPNKNVELRPSGYVYYRDLSVGSVDAAYHTGYITKGKFVTKDLILGHKYEVVSYYGSSSFTFTKVLEFANYSERVNLKGNYCDGF